MRSRMYQFLAIFFEEKRVFEIVEVYLRKRYLDVIHLSVRPTEYWIGGTNNIFWMVNKFHVFALVEFISGVYCACIEWALEGLLSGSIPNVSFNCVYVHKSIEEKRLAGR